MGDLICSEGDQSYSSSLNMSIYQENFSTPEDPQIFDSSKKTEGESLSQEESQYLKASPNTRANLPNNKQSSFTKLFVPVVASNPVGTLAAISAGTALAGLMLLTGCGEATVSKSGGSSNTDDVDALNSLPGSGNLSSCTDDNDCSSGNLCINGACGLYTCSEDENCPEESYCTKEIHQDEGSCLRTPPEEICNGVDDDRDGMTDEKEGSTPEEFSPLARREGSGLGECRPVDQVCREGEFVDQDVRFKEKNENGGETLCDGLDNDCDGLTDENLDNCCEGQTNLAPTLNPIGDKIVNEAQNLSFPVTAIDNENLEIEIDDLPEGASFDAASQSFDWRPDYNQGGRPSRVYTPIFSVTDSCGLSSAESVSIFVNNVNREPVLEAIPNREVEGGDEVSFQIRATDPDIVELDPEERLFYNAQSLPSGASFDISTQIFSWQTRSLGDFGQHHVTFQARDLDGAVAQGVAQINVVGVDEIMTTMSVEEGGIPILRQNDRRGDYGLAWTTPEKRVGFARLDSIGAPTSFSPTVGFKELTTTHSGVTGFVSAENQYLATWGDRRFGILGEIYYRLYGDNGDPLGEETRLTYENQVPPTPQNAKAAWNASLREYAIVLQRPRNDPSAYAVDMYRISSQGALLASNLRISEGGGSAGAPVIISDQEDGFATFWIDRRNSGDDIYWTRTYPNGNKRDLNGDSQINGGDNMRLTSDRGAINIAGYPSPVRNDNGYTVAYQDNRDGKSNIYLSKLHFNGNKADLNEDGLVNSHDDIQITTEGATLPSLAWTGEEFGMAWRDERSRNGEIYFARFDADGNMIGSEVKVTNTSTSSGLPSLVWNDVTGVYMVSWNESVGTRQEIRTARISGTFSE